MTAPRETRAQSAAQAKPSVQKINGGAGGRIPPSALDAEAAVLSTIILKADDLDEVRQVLTAETFYSEANRRIYETVCDLTDSGQPVDLVTVADRLRSNGRLAQVGGAVYLSQIVDATPAVQNVGEHARIIRDKWRVRTAIATAQTKAAEGYTSDLADPETTQAWLEEAETAFADIAHLRETNFLKPLPDLLREVQTEITAAYERGSSINGISTGYRLLDRMLGGLQDGESMIVAGRPGMSKTSFILNMAVLVAKQGYAVPIFSLEMPMSQLGQRLVSTEAKIDLRNLRTGSFRATDWKKINDAIAVLNLPIFIDDTPNLTIYELRARVKRLQREIAQGKHPKVTKERIGFVGLDYMQLMRNAMKGRSREEEVAENSKQQKELAKELGIPFVAVSQLNRAVETRAVKEKRPQLSDLRESGAIEMDADTVMFIYRDDYYFKDSPDKGTAELIIGKQRNGPTGMVRVRFTPEYTRFDNFMEGEMDEWDSYDPGATDPSPEQSAAPVVQLPPPRPVQQELALPPMPTDEEDE